MKEIDERKSKLIEALKAEKDGFEQFAQDTTDHELTIQYLQTGIFDRKDLDDCDMLYSAVNNYECLLRDYNC